MNEITCTRNEEENDCNEESYFISKITWQDIPLSAQEEHPGHYFRDFRNGFIDKLQAEIESYFPEGRLEDFMIADHRKFPAEEHELRTYGQLEVFRLADIFNLPNNDLHNQWRALLISLHNDDMFCQKKNLHPRDFWSHYLSQKEEYFGNEIKRLVQVILTIPTGSADAERAFSYHNNIKTKLRNRLSHKMAESLMRIKMNSVKNLADFPAVSMAKAWVLKGHQRTDTPFQKTKRPREEEEDKEESNILYGDDHDDINYNNDFLMAAEIL